MGAHRDQQRPPFLSKTGKQWGSFNRSVLLHRCEMRRFFQFQPEVQPHQARRNACQVVARRSRTRPRSPDAST